MNHDALANYIFWHVIPIEDREDARQVQELATARGKSRSWAVINWHNKKTSVDAPSRQAGRIEIPTDPVETDEVDCPEWLSQPEQVRTKVDVLDRVATLEKVATPAQRRRLALLIEGHSMREVADLERVSITPVRESLTRLRARAEV